MAYELREKTSFMEEKYVLTLGDGEDKIPYLIERVICMDNQRFFTLVNLITGDFMFGEYTGQLPEDEDEAREIIWNDFRNGCETITYPDGYIVDDLYEMIDFF